MVRTGRVRWTAWKRIWKAHNRRKPRKPLHLKPTDGFLSNVDAYPRQVILYYGGAEHREFKRLVSELGDRLKTTNQSDAVLCALRTLAKAGVSTCQGKGRE